MVNDYGQSLHILGADKISIMTAPERLARIKKWLDLLREEFLALVTHDDTYWRLQKEVIQRNHRLLTMRSPVFELLDSAYVSTTASAIRRLIETQNGGKTNVSLRILLDEIGKHPNVLERPMSAEQIRNDLAQWMRWSASSNLTWTESWLTLIGEAWQQFPN